jgi:hypothetical protein
LEEQLLGALHDVLERSNLTTRELADKGFPPRVLTSLEHISRVEGEDYVTYIERVAEDGLAYAGLSCTTSATKWTSDCSMS